jgi:hypothetical protein
LLLERVDPRERSNSTREWNGLEQAIRSGSWMAMSHAEQVVGGFVVLHSRARRRAAVMLSM